MANMIDFVLTAVCIASVHCIGYWPDESQNLGIEEKNEDIEYDENPRIQIRTGNGVITDTVTAGIRYGNIEVLVYAFNETFLLNLRLNRHLFASSYVEKIITKTGVIYQSLDPTDNNCYYIGRVEARDDSTASVSICNGIVGYFTSGDFSYHIERRDGRFNGPNVVYRIRSNSYSVYDSGSESSEFSDRLHFNSKAQRHKRSFNWPQNGDGRDKVLELYIANDYSQFLDKGKNTATVFQRAKDAANFASSSFQTQGVYFVIVGMEVWTNGDKFPINSSDVDATLQSWNNYRMQNINPNNSNDHAVLITRVQFENQDSGRAIIGKICSNLFSGSIVVDSSNSVFVTGSAMARQVGHSFGLRDDGQMCECPSQNSACIMSSVQSSIPATNWSVCSIQQFNYVFSTGVDICMYDAPLAIYQSTVPTCGNGIVEAGEQCDCGRAPQTECNPLCCSSTTCQLTGSASCASGRCCNIARCQILKSGSLCRSITGDCDLPEHCDGVLSTCPIDTYKPDGTRCTINGDSVYCFSGKCRSHRSQCELIYGIGTNSSSVICYARFNINGEHYGNCGLKWLPSVTYIACQPKDALCGKLQCDTSSQQLAYYKNPYKFSMSWINNLTCGSVIFDFGLRIQDPGLVPNGASCGDGKMCINQMCVNVSSLQTPCLESCQANQVCNNLGHCQSQGSDNLPMSSSAPSTTKPILSSVGGPGRGSSTSTLLSLSSYASIVVILPQMFLSPMSSCLFISMMQLIIFCLF